MKQAHLYVLALVIPVILVILVITGSHAARAHAHRNESRLALSLVSQQASELVRLRHSAEDSSVPVRPDGGLAGKVSQALTRSGLASAVLQSLSPENETTDKGLVRQRATLTLSGLSLPEVGRFLDAWRTNEPGWVISGLDLSPAGTGTPGADLPLRAVITMEALFRDQPRMPASTRTGAAP